MTTVRDTDDPVVSIAAALGYSQIPSRPHSGS
jgi:hypothetical protein